MSMRFSFLAVISLFFISCGDVETNITHDNVVQNPTTVPHPVPTTDSSEFPPHAPDIL